MGRFEGPRDRKSNDYRGSSRGRGSRSGPRGRDSRDNSGDRPSTFEESRARGDSRGRGREFTKTRVTCDSCGEKCEVPFKPTSNKPLYCSDCFGKKSPDRGSDRSRGPSHGSSKSDRDLDLIHEKLNKIMEALDIN